MLFLNLRLVCNLCVPVMEATWIMKKNISENRSWKMINFLIDLLSRNTGKTFETFRSKKQIS